MPLFMNVFSQSQLTLHYRLRQGILLDIKASIDADPAGRISSPVQTISFATKLRQQTPIRRSGIYKPPNWDFNYVESLKHQFAEERYINRSNVLKERVKMMLDEVVEPLSHLELIDDLQRLGISYHFQDEIQSILSTICKENYISKMANEQNLCATALGFRLLRQYGFDISQEAFTSFTDERGDFKSNLGKDTKAMLHLYEASHLLTESERTLESAREFAAKHLKKNLDDDKVDQEPASLVQHASKLPLHWRMLSVEARWFIDIYEKRPYLNPTLLEFAKLDFNIVQATHQDDLKYASRWWEYTRLAENLSFARDRLVENFFWTIGETFEPQHGYCRRISAKGNALVTIIDDIYDVYGTLDELELFTDVVERWDIAAIDQLPDCMKIFCFALHNFINELAYDAMKEQGVQVIQYLRKTWVDLCKSLLQEAKWYFSGYVPTLQEYLNNAWISIGTPVMLLHGYLGVTNPITNEALECFVRYNNIIYCSGLILRLADDLGTSSEELKRGDVPKSIQCYMNETGASEEEAREYIRLLISEAWKQVNKERVTSSPFTETFVGFAVNLGRMAQCMYQYGDGHGLSNSQTKDRIRASLFEPIDLV